MADDIPQRIKDRLPIQEVIGARIKLTRQGREYMALCPFHVEKSPSFSVSPQKGFYHCFGCGASGDIFTFVQEYDKVDFRTALDGLARQAGIALPAFTPQQAEHKARRQGLTGIMEAARTWYQSQLYSPAGGSVQRYLQGRGLTVDTIRTFGLGFAPDGGEALKKTLLAQGFPLTLQIEAGLLSAPEGKTPWDRFRGRLMIPIRDRQGATIAFGGRSLSPDQEPKYLNSPETPLFHKGDNLFAQDKAFTPIAKSGTAVVVEGYFDAIALHQAGIIEAVAPLGTALGEDQIRQLWSLADIIELCFDGDKAGARAALRATERALPFLVTGKSLRFLLLPPGEDPDTLVLKGGSEAFAAVRHAGLSLSEFLYKTILASQNPQTPEGRAACIKAFDEVTEPIPDAILRRVLRQDLKDRFYSQTRPSQKGRGTPQARTNGVISLPSPTQARGRASAALLLALFNHPSLLDEVAEALVQLPLPDKNLDMAREHLLHYAASVETQMLQNIGHFFDDGVTAALTLEWPWIRLETPHAEALKEWRGLFGALLTHQPHTTAPRRVFRF
ncbi:MAG: DNA primase [Holosporales bacterium]